MVSDIHPIDSDSPKWEWHMTEEMRYRLAEQGVALARGLLHEFHLKIDKKHAFFADR